MGQGGWRFSERRAGKRGVTFDWLVEKMEGTRHELNVKIAALMDLEKRAELGDRSKRIPF